jgi:hypothetical protein
MSNRKIIVIREEVDKMLGNICDAALKGAGMQVLSSVNGVIEAVVEDPDYTDKVMTE